LGYDCVKIGDGKRNQVQHFTCFPWDEYGVITN